MKIMRTLQPGLSGDDPLATVSSVRTIPPVATIPDTDTATRDSDALQSL